MPRDPYDLKRRRDPYGRRRYDDGGTVAPDPPGTTTLPPPPDAFARASAFSDERRAEIAKRDKEMRNIQEKQQLNVDQMTNVLNETTAAIKRRREGATSLPLLMMGAAMMGGTGNFGQQLGAGFAGMAQGIKATREEEAADDKQLADIELKKATIANAPLESRLAYMKALQTGDIAAMRGIEQAIIKAQFGGTKIGADERSYGLWKQSPGNENKSYQDYLKFKDELKGSDTEDKRNYDLWTKSPGNEGKSYQDYLIFKQGVQARSPADIQYQTQMNKERAAENEKAGLKEGDPGFKPPLTLEEAGAARKAAEAGATTTARETAEARVKAEQSLPTFIANAERATTTIDKMLVHPGIAHAVGSWLTPVPPLPGSDKANFIAMHDHLVGQAFLTAYDRLRGAGAITEMEGLKAAQAELISARNQSKEAYMAALRDYQGWIRRSVEIMHQKAGKTAPNTKQDNPSSTTGGSPSPAGQTGSKPGGGKPWEQYGGGGG